MAVVVWALCSEEFSFVECEMFGFGLPEAVILGIIVLVLFGRRLPSLFRSLGESLPAFKQGLAQDHLEIPVGDQKNLERFRN